MDSFNNNKQNEKRIISSQEINNNVEYFIDFMTRTRITDQR